ncbi:UNVERIFIED_CONTAM: hypothetical protein Slati_4432900 [Sesamum latifolium]|uniref:Reverse transcriptase zinc-binding domain-containing protein n=1 Tax=Sesamum latifolium TaxID=2727402 RepID=A0AAW2SQG9_9LAMI
MCYTPRGKDADIHGAASSQLESSSPLVHGGILDLANLSTFGRIDGFLDLGLSRPEDAGLIIGIDRISGCSDPLRWHFDIHGRYSVKSGYNLICQGAVPHTQFGPAVSTSFKSEGWEFIWRATVPPKVRLFAWRVCPDSLPTSSNLVQRGVTKDGVCPWCGAEGEDLFHNLLRCHYARLIWAMSHLPWASITCSHSNPEAWLCVPHKMFDGPSFGRFLLICWHLRGARNRQLFENITLTAEYLLERVWSLEKGPSRYGIRGSN